MLNNYYNPYQHTKKINTKNKLFSKNKKPIKIQLSTI